MPATESDLAALTRLIRGRRSLKPFDMDPSRPVDGLLLRHLLENATWAPNHGMTEPWRFHVFQDAARRALSEAMQRIYRALTPPAEFREDKLRKMSENPLLAPVVVGWCVEAKGGPKIPEIEEIEAAACAAQNFLLSAHAAGLGAYWSSPPLVYSRDFADFLGLDESGRCLGLLYLGWPRPSWTRPEGVRKPLEENLIAVEPRAPGATL